jgi:hypothetical protein
MVMQAQDTFVATLEDGTEMRVTRGQVLPDGHELVKRDASGTLFKPLDLGEETPAAKPKTSRATKSSSSGVSA